MGQRVDPAVFGAFDLHDVTGRGAVLPGLDGGLGVGDGLGLLDSGGALLVGCLRGAGGLVRTGQAEQRPGRDEVTQGPRGSELKTP